MYRKAKIRYTLVCLLALFVCICTLGCQNVANYIAQEEINSSQPEDDFEIEPIDAEAFLSQIGYVKEKVDVSSSITTQSESDVISYLEDRDLLQFEVTTSYSIDSRYTGETNASKSSSEKHPVYETIYVTENGDVWSIMIINGTVMATPNTYNMEHANNAPIMFSETGFIMSYDCITNCFFEIEPDPAVIRVIKLDRIDAENIEQLTSEVIEGK